MLITARHFKCRFLPSRLGASFWAFCSPAGHISSTLQYAFVQHFLSEASRGCDPHGYAKAPGFPALTMHRALFQRKREGGDLSELRSPRPRYRSKAPLSVLWLPLALFLPDFYGRTPRSLERGGLRIPSTGESLARFD